MLRNWFCARKSCHLPSASHRLLFDRLDWLSTHRAKEFRAVFQRPRYRITCAERASLSLFSASPASFAILPVPRAPLCCTGPPPSLWLTRRGPADCMALSQLDTRRRNTPWRRWAPAENRRLVDLVNFRHCDYTPTPTSYLLISVAIVIARWREERPRRGIMIYGRGETRRVPRGERK